MARLRPLPLLVAALAAILAWKAISIWPGAPGPIGLAEAQTKAAPPAAAPPAAAPSAGAPLTGAPAPAAPPPAAGAPVSDVGNLSKAEFEALEGLSKRREALEVREREMDVRDNLLAVAEKRVQERISELKELEARIKAMIDRQENASERDVRSLVKVYENMKPKDAARIFDQLDLPILLDVTQRMKENKLAPVLAVMDAGRAQKVTVELANRRQMGTADKPRGG
jgi:flagellar motility protein MotE (MotC chaperone)